MKKKLAKKIENTNILDISIKYGGERINFNLAEELKISEARVNEEIKSQPSYFGFLLILMVKLDRLKNDKKAELNKIKARLFIRFKEEIDPHTNRIYSNDLAEAKVETNSRYQKALRDYNKVEEDWATIKSCVEAFQQRGSLIQTISANYRIEKTIN